MAEPLDSSFSYLFKQAVKLNVPVRYVLIEPDPSKSDILTETFNLDEYPNARFTTVFEYVRNLVMENKETTLSRIWTEIQKDGGDIFNPPELVQIWLHAIPEYQVDNAALYIQVVDFLNLINEPVPYTDMTGFLEYYHNIWLPRFNQDLQNEKKTVDKIVQAQVEIGKVPPVLHSPIQPESTVITYTYPYSTDPLPDLFNSSKSSYVIPFIQFNPGKELSGPYYKIFRGLSIDSQPNYNNVTISSGNATRARTIYLNIWAGPDDEDLQDLAREGKKDLFYLSTISYLPNLKLVRVNVNSPSNIDVDYQTIINRIHEHIPSLSKPNSKEVTEVRLTGSFLIYNIDLIPDVFIYLVTNHPLFSTYLYVEESLKTFAVKQRLNIHYRGASSGRSDDLEGGRNSSSVSANLSQIQLNSGQTVKTSDGKTYSISTPISAMEVRMTKASGRKVADQFIQIMARLVRIYSDVGKKVYQDILNFVPDYPRLLEKKTVEVNNPVPKLRQKENSRISILRNYAPDVFVSNYVRQCQGDLKPLPVYQEDLAYWQSNKFRNKRGDMEERQILAFPPDNPKYYFVCPDDSAPYPSLKENKLSPNRKEYPMIPCCRTTKQLNTSSKLNRLSTGQGAITRTVRSNYEIVTDKILPPGRIGLISTVVANFLQKYSPSSGQIRRLGVPQGTNSFIHCVALAMGYPGYLTSSNRDEYVDLLRSQLFDLGVRPELLRQELYNMSNEDIIRHGTNNDEFFDPLMYYRALEILFSCNIYVFNLNDKNRKTGQEMSLLQLPRYKFFRATPPILDYPAVLIVRHLGSETNSLDYPQCELIIDRTPVGIRHNFGSEMNQLLSPAVRFVERLITWQVLDRDKRSNLIVRQNVYSVMNFQVIFRDVQLLGQVIDKAGKTRTFLISPRENIEVSVEVPPTAPLNIPEITPERAIQKLPTYNRPIELFGSPIGVTTDIDRKIVTGLWFSAGDLEYAFYCPCLDLDIDVILTTYPNLVINPGVPISHPAPRNEQLSPLARIRILQQASRFIKQILQYLYLTTDRTLSASQFLAEVAIMAPEDKPDSVYLYNMKSINRILPTGSYLEILKDLSKQLPLTFPNNRLLIYDQQMYTGVLYNFRKWIDSIEGIPVSSDTYQELQGYYNSKQDFQVSDDEFILAGTSEYSSWSNTYVVSSNLQQRSVQNLKNNIQTRLNINGFSYQEPYIYQKSGNNTIGTSLDPRQDKFYLVQNVAAGSFRRAVQVAYTWYINKRNLGFNSGEYSEEMVPVHIVYQISQGGSIIVSNNLSQNAIRYLEILEYLPGIYAALLPIL